MERIAIRVGDVFCTASPSWLGRMIAWFQRFNSSDNEAAYSHAGFVMDSDGKTFEALDRIKYADLNRYEGKRVLVGRHVDMNTSVFLRGFAAVKSELGDVYPAWRLALHMIPPLAKYLATGECMVCSEVTAKFLMESVGYPNWKGVTPDMLADAIRRWKEFSNIVDGIYGVDWSIKHEQANVRDRPS